jgi:hypothetical protein
MDRPLYVGATTAMIGLPLAATITTIQAASHECLACVAIAVGAPAGTVVRPHPLTGLPDAVATMELGTAMAAGVAVAVGAPVGMLRAPS